MRSLPLLLVLICLTNGKIQLTTTVLKERIARLSYWYSEDAVLGDQPFRNLDSSVEYLNKMVETVIYLSASEAVEYNVTNNVINFDLTMRKQEVDLKIVNKTAFETELFGPAINLSSALTEKVLKPNQQDMQLFYQICAANKPGVLLGRAPKILSKDTVTMSYLNATNYGSKEFLRYAIFARRLTMHLLAMVHFCDNNVPPGLDEDLKHIKSNFGLVDFELKMTGDHRKDHWPLHHS
ncbi:hypothetical protein L596_020333 [Steinernema carpocapsae]|uniref:Uncharacterized protein n=1 Tax=Steinernema carpocapsae TaxID=34508 RepID=A0A4V6A0W3_STECR|nr:hypothetical protein L596_020333 [Steinernema carpocapsae]